MTAAVKFQRPDQQRIDIADASLKDITRVLVEAFIAAHPSAAAQFCVEYGGGLSLLHNGSRGKNGRIHPKDAHQALFAFEQLLRSVRDYGHGNIHIYVRADKSDG